MAGLRSCAAGPPIQRTQVLNPTQLHATLGNPTQYPHLPDFFYAWPFSFHSFCHSPVPTYSRLFKPNQAPRGGPHFSAMKFHSKRYKKLVFPSLSRGRKRVFLGSFFRVLFIQKQLPFSDAVSIANERAKRATSSHVTNHSSLFKRCLFFVGSSLLLARRSVISRLRQKFREVHGPTKVTESHDTRADSSNAASFVHELSFTAAPSQHGLVEQSCQRPKNEPRRNKYSTRICAVPAYVFAANLIKEKS